MKQNIPKNKIVFLVLSLLTLNYLLYSFFKIEGVKNVVRLVAAALLFTLLVLQFLEGQIRRRHIALAALAVYQVLVWGESSLNIAFLMILTMTLSEVESKTIFRQAFWSLAAFAGVAALSLALGIVENWEYAVGDRMRNTLGFVNVNNAGVFVFSVQASYLLSRERVRVWNLGIVAVTAVAVFCFTDSRTPFLCIMLMMAFWGIVPRLPEKLVRVCLCVGVGVLFLTVFIWQLPFVNSELGNQVLSLRPRYFTEYIQQQTVWNLIFGGSRVGDIDNMYLVLLYNSGIVIYVLFAAAALKAAQMLLRRGKYMQLAYVLTMLIGGVFECSALRPELVCAPLLWLTVAKNLPWGKGRSLLAGKLKDRMAFKKKGPEQ